jgi:PAS domain S-box-containing protein/putative nucleotidyltransferase with HDIG domain
MKIKGSDTEMAGKNPRKEPAVIKQPEDQPREIIDSVIDTVHESLIALDQDLRVIKVSRSFYETFKVKPEESLGQHIYDLGNKQLDIPKLRELLEAILPERSTFDDYEIEYDFPTIGRRTLLLNARQIQGALGKDRVILLAIEDITERRQAEKVSAGKAESLLSASEEKYRYLVENSGEGICVVHGGLLVFVNSTLAAIAGSSVSEMMNKPFLDYVHPEDRETVNERESRRIGGEKYETSYTFRGLDKAGRTKWLSLNVVTITWEGKPATLNFLEDITQRKQSEEALYKSNQLYRSLFENMINGFCYCRMLYDQGQPRDFIYLNVNAAFEKQTGLKNVNGKRVSNVIPGIYETDRELMETYGRVASTGIAETLEIYVSALGMWFSISIYSPQKEYFVAVFDGITERKLSEEKLLKSYESVKKTLNDAIITMVKMVEMRDPYTAGHQQKVADLSTAIAGEMKLEDARIDQIRTAALIHDIGKLYIPSDILSKPGKLLDIEFSLIKTHAQSGYDIVIGMNFPGVIAQSVLQHHERLDGSGYPNALKGEDTLLEAKILAVADVIEAMASHRPYRPALGIDKALEEISKNRDKLYDPDVVDICLGLFESGRYEFKTV